MKNEITIRIGKYKQEEEQHDDPVEANSKMGAKGSFVVGKRKIVVQDSARLIKLIYTPYLKDNARSSRSRRSSIPGLYFEVRL